MKKIMILLVAILGFAASAKAQDYSKMAAGLNFNVGVGDSYTNFGLGAKYQYRFANHGVERQASTITSRRIL